MDCRRRYLPAHPHYPANPFGSCRICHGTRFEFWGGTFKINIVEGLKRVGYDMPMTEEKPRYKWPRYVLAGVIVFLAAAIVWVVFEARKVEHQRDFNAPIESR